MRVASTISAGRRKVPPARRAATSASWLARFATTQRPSAPHLWPCAIQSGPETSLVTSSWAKSGASTKDGGTATPAPASACAAFGPSTASDASFASSAIWKLSMMANFSSPAATSAPM